MRRENSLGNIIQISIFFVIFDKIMQPSNFGHILTMTFLSILYNILMNRDTFLPTDFGKYEPGT